MLIVWRGFGYLVPLIAILSLIVASRFTSDDHLGGGVALLVSAALLWVIGTRLNREIEKGHTLFWIPMQYWGIAVGVLGLVVLSGH